MAGSLEHVPGQLNPDAAWSRPEHRRAIEHVPTASTEQLVQTHAPTIVVEQPAPEQPNRPAASGGHLIRNSVLAMLLSGMLFVGVGGYLSWQWLDGHLLHWGVQGGATETVNSAELLQRVRSFELATVKHTYAAQAHVDTSKVLNAGPKKIDLPGWVDGQKLDAKGNVIITAGIDLARVKPEDMTVSRQGKDTLVTIQLPPSAVLSAELAPDTLDTSTSSGLFSRLRQSVGLSEKDLRDQAADQVTKSARDAAIQQGILDDADREAERRLQAFLNSLPQAGNNGRVIYTVIVSPQPAR